MLKPTLQLKLGQSLTMTPQLQQAIRLLQLPILDLNAEIQEALDSGTTPADLALGSARVSIAIALSERAYTVHAENCPVYRTIHGCVDITTSLELEDISTTGDNA